MTWPPVTSLVTGQVQMTLEVFLGNSCFLLSEQMSGQISSSATKGIGLEKRK